MFKNFKKSDRTSWLEQIEKEFKGRMKVEDTIRNIAGNIRLHPFVDESNRIFHPVIHSFPTHVAAGITVDNHFTNSQLLHLLNIGAGAILLDERFNGDINALLEGVQINLLTFIVLNNIPVYHEILNRMKKDYREDSSNVLHVEGLQQIIQTSDFYTDPSYSLHCKKILDESIAQGLVMIKLSNQLLFQTALIRAIRLYAQEKFNSSTFMMAGICDHMVSYDEERLICDTAQSLSARTGGIDVIFNTLQTESSTPFQTEKIHIQNILEMESKINQVKDPFTGSYYIEQITAQIIQSWS